MPSPIEDYALLGDCETAALVCRSGSIDWLCWPRFDSDACFAALLGGPEHGGWWIGPAAPAHTVSRRYREGTMVLETVFETIEGTVALIDFMPPRGLNSDLVRIVEGRRGRVRMAMELVIRFDYGATVPWARRLANGDLNACAGPNQIVLRTSAPFEGRDLKTVADFTVAAGERVPFVLTHSASHLPPPEPVDPAEALADTEAFWRDWIGRCTYRGPHEGAVKRSLMLLKALTYRPTGGMVAAATTSLPEHIGGVRN